MKTVKIFISLLLFTIITLVGSSVQALSYFTTAGDISGDGRVDSGDARSVLRIAVGTLKATTFVKNKADMNFDGRVTSEDARLALRASVGSEPSYRILAQAYTVRDFVISNKYYQAAKSSYGNKCWGFAAIYAKAINTANNAIISNNVDKGNDPSGVALKQTTGDKATVLKAIATELKNNKACVIQVNGSGNGRHYVVAIGYKTTANLNNLNDTDLLILDVYDGKIKPVSSTTRYLFSNYNRYGYYYQMFTVN